VQPDFSRGSLLNQATTESSVKDPCITEACRRGGGGLTRSPHVQKLNQGDRRSPSLEVSRDVRVSSTGSKRRRSRSADVQ
jgi:hypothetical protein